MREELSSNDRNAKASRTGGMVILSALLMTGLALPWPDPTFAQTFVAPNMQPLPGAGTTSPLPSGAGQRAGIPLDSTEVVTPGISPVVPSQNVGAANCGGSGNGASGGALFDGGGLNGLSGSMSLSCADSRPPRSLAPSLSPVGRVGIPLGATELGNAGISPPSPLAGPGQSNNPIAPPVGSTQPASSAGLPGAEP